MPVHPMRGGTYTVSSGYGPRWGTHHNGLDFAAPIGTPIYAAADGVVVEGKDRTGVGGFGSWIWLDCQASAGVDLIYGHVKHSGILVTAGDRVTAGQQIGVVGNEGESTGPHLHFEVWGPPGRIGGAHRDPARWLIGATDPTSETEKPVMPPIGTPFDADWSQRFGFGSPRGLSQLIGVCIHTTENTLGTPAENVANYQISTETGSYHALVDNTSNDNIRSIQENTPDWTAWAAGPIGNHLALHLSFVAQAKMSRAEWLEASAMLAEGADIVAYWCKKFGFPVAKIDHNQLKAGRKGIFGHVDVSNAWHEVNHTDPGAGFPWDVFLRMVEQRVHGTKPSTPKPAPKPTTPEDTAMSGFWDQMVPSLVDRRKKFKRRDLLSLIDYHATHANQQSKQSLADIAATQSEIKLLRDDISRLADIITNGKV